MRLGEAAIRPGTFALQLTLLLAVALPTASRAATAIPAFAAEEVLAPGTETVGPKSMGAAAMRAQIRLDRARFSPGEIDGRYGTTLKVAVNGFQKRHSIPVTGVVDAATWQALEQADTAPTLAKYTILDTDVAGPFVPVPHDMMEKAKLPSLGYGSIQEALGERFHVAPDLLVLINPGKDLSKAGEEILVPNVGPAGKLEGAKRVVVDKSSSIVVVEDEAGEVLAQFPATTGSKHDPLPIGKWKINGVGRDPVFKYNPALFWDANSKQSKAVIPAGPNNPVGVVWVDLSKSHYGIHGTPEPSKISKSESHGCIRLTNWDAMTLAASVSPGMPALLRR